LTLIDCCSDSVLIDTATLGNMYAVAHTGDGKKVYIVHHYSYDRLEVLDAGSLSLLATVDWDYGGAGANPFLVLSDSTDKLYWFAHDEHGTEQDSVLVVDTRSDTVIARLQAGFQQRRGCLDRTGRYIFCTSAGDSSLVIYDTQSDRVVAVYGTPPEPYAVVPNPELGCIYVEFPDVILVYPDTPPGVHEMSNAEVRATNCGPTVVSGTLVLGAAGSRQHSAYRAELLDVSGRKVMDLASGANDVRALAPGVYFLRGPKAEDGRPDAAVRKVVMTK